MTTNTLSPSSDSSCQADYEALASTLATELARVERLISDPAVWTSTDHEGLLRELQIRLSQLLEDHRVELRDHTGDPWVDGLPLTVVYIRDGVSDPVIVETIRPSIAMNDKVISHGYVVIGDKSELEQVK